jgi:hypothetical protein
MPIQPQSVTEVAAMLGLTPVEVVGLAGELLPVYQRVPALTFHRQSVEAWRRKLSDGGAGGATFLRELLRFWS